MSRPHKVKTYHWYCGILTTAEYIFDNLREAIAFIRCSGVGHAKVYDPEGDLVHAENPPQLDSYA